MPQVLWDKAAIQDLDNIWDYIGSENHDPIAADRFIDLICERCKAYSQQPNMGTSWPELAPEVCFFVVGVYVVIYRPTGDGIGVARILHGARDIQAIFQESHRQ
ncbi:Plasmid stabilization system protein [Symmachiella macrocystis]|uniref:Plasmid stabilization system protein n=1 Tax=Symmachiella macrocystis TaxID=2527985 RepID=A0A5C6BPM7_9PLAN|nr:type II toxin-antitoxin system RelE/ParE family toxin [Symmachiella macrocystis]TWU13642.1 Plasmid stabilization system protein [Symmachiella macrocystis]